MQRLLDYQVSLGLQETEVLKDDINEAMEPHCPKDKDGKPNCKSTAVVVRAEVAWGNNCGVPAVHLQCDKDGSMWLRQGASNCGMPPRAGHA